MRTTCTTAKHTLLTFLLTHLLPANSPATATATANATAATHLHLRDRAAALNGGRLASSGPQPQPHRTNYQQQQQRPPQQQQYGSAGSLTPAGHLVAGSGGVPGPQQQQPQQPQQAYPSELRLEGDLIVQVSSSSQRLRASAGAATELVPRKLAPTVVLR